MISRKAARTIAEVYVITFSQVQSDSFGGHYYTINTTRLYDFLYDHDHPAHFCNLAKRQEEPRSTRRFKEFLMQLHTGESVVATTPDWSWKQREKVGQRYLHSLAEDILNHWAQADPRYKSKTDVDKVAQLRKQLELEGYRYEDGRLLESEADVLDVKEEVGVIQALYKELSLANEETTFHHLALTDEHYLADRWDDAISNSRKFLESILKEVATAHSSRRRREELSPDVLSRPVRIRDYLQREGLLEVKEKQAVDSVYGLLSDTGGHPYMAQSEQARLLRHLALTFSQFVLLRLKGWLDTTD